jgi:hypothetical protein
MPTPNYFSQKNLMLDANYPKSSFLVPGTKSGKSFLCPGTVNISLENRGGTRGYFVPWHNGFYAMALKTFF